MKTLSVLFLFVIPLFGDALFESKWATIFIIGGMIVVCVAAWLIGKLSDKWEKIRREFDERDMFD